MSESGEATETRYRLVEDENCHWAVIPADKLKEWQGFCLSNDAWSGDYPDWCKLINGSPSLLTFTDPKFGGCK